MVFINFSVQNIAFYYLITLVLQLKLPERLKRNVQGKDLLFSRNRALLLKNGNFQEFQLKQGLLMSLIFSEILYVLFVNAYEGVRENRFIFSESVNIKKNVKKFGFHMLREIRYFVFFSHQDKKKRAPRRFHFFRQKIWFCEKLRILV